VLATLWASAGNDVASNASGHAGVRMTRGGAVSGSKRASGRGAPRMGKRTNDAGGPPRRAGQGSPTNPALDACPRRELSQKRASSNFGPATHTHIRADHLCGDTRYAHRPDPSASEVRLSDGSAIGRQRVRPEPPASSLCTCRYQCKSPAVTPTCADGPLK